MEETVQHEGTIHLHHVTDTHLGAPDVAEEELRKRIALIADDPWARWTFGGDGGDLIKHNDRRYSITELHPRYRVATDLVHATKEHFAEMFKPIAGKCWGACDGNHERKVETVYGGKPLLETLCALGLERKWVGIGGFVQVVFNVGKRRAILGQTIDLFHGWQGGRRSGAKLNQAELEMSFSDADIVLRGHSHDPMCKTFMVKSVTKSGNGGEPRLVTRPRTFVNGGCWRHNYREVRQPVDADKLSEVEGDLWTEYKGFRNHPVGGAVLVLHFDQGHGRTSKTNGRPAMVGHSLVDGPAIYNL